MSRNRETRIIIRAGGKVPRIASVYERASGDLVIALKNNGVYIDAYNEQAPSIPILNQKYSVHRSENSPSSINVIKRTLELQGAGEIVTRNHTEAIKKYGNLAYLFSARSPNLRNSSYDTILRDCERIDLGECSPDNFVLVYSIFVADRARKFLLKRRDDFDLARAEFSSFSVVVLWSFFWMLPDSSGFKSHNMTIPPEKIPAHLKDVFLPNVAGFDEGGCLWCHCQARTKLHEQFLIHATKKMGGDTTYAETSVKIGFSREGLRSSGSYNRRIKAIAPTIYGR